MDRNSGKIDNIVYRRSITNAEHRDSEGRQ